MESTGSLLFRRSNSPFFKNWLKTHYFSLAFKDFQLSVSSRGGFLQIHPSDSHFGVHVRDFINNND